ncbi:hypothetical protein ACVIU7_007919 [Bradyrhizobium liaoningense]|nr:hypothetical protein GCM10007858_01630 [Bradyrhizobium liaoningense]
MVFKLLCAASKTWRRLKGTNQLPKLIAGVSFENGIEVIQLPATRPAPTGQALPPCLVESKEARRWLDIKPQLKGRLTIARHALEAFSHNGCRVC